MFEAAELGRKVSKTEYKEREPILRARLLEVQARLRQADFPVVVLFAGVDGAGKGESANLLSEWMDPRRIVTRAYSKPTQEESERPEFWRYWRDLPSRGHMGMFLSAWYHGPLLQRVYDKISPEGLDDRLDHIISFEKTLAEDGALILKFWMHLGKSQQEKRFRQLESDDFLKWRVTDKDWKHWKMYEDFTSVAEHIIMRTSTGKAPWRIIEGADPRYRSLEVGNLLLEALTRHLDQRDALALVNGARPTPESAPPPVVEDESDPHSWAEAFPVPVAAERPVTVLSRMDLKKQLTKADYSRRLDKYQGKLNLLHRLARDQGRSTILVFEGWDAGGKGGAIRRVTASLDARDFEVISIAAPTDEERSHHYLWRFWRHVSRAGRFTIFDRSWYGRVLVERVEGFASREEWERAYMEINEFEQNLVAHGTVLLKFWLHVSPQQQVQRFFDRHETPYKRWKLTPEDWRNRGRWAEYEEAVNAMVERTSTGVAPWVLVEGDDKRYARIKVLKEVCAALERAVD